MKVLFIALILSVAITFSLAVCPTPYTKMTVKQIANTNTVSNVNTYVLEYNAASLLCTVNNILLDMVSSHSVCSTATSYSGKSFYFKYEFGFELGNPGSVQFRFGIDFGLGGVVKVDGNIVSQTFLDQWWALSWSTPNQFYLNTAPIALGAGCHVVEVIGKEACCDGAQTLQINANDDGWVSVSPTNLANIYEPPIVQQSPACIGQAFWTSVNPAVPQKWCYCNCWVPGAYFNATQTPPYHIAQLAPACVLDPANIQFWTSCVWSCPADTSFNSYGVLAINNWLNDCVYHP